ncbi:MAG: DHA2 family efflux MFS transporter permease subunit, partial [Alphaproteobacteria bacterium]|nr:DHA2 family efflux MFS transporter permease subunit [Alphaproteobacteria bacterium]
YIALPNMKGNLSATPDQAGWIITSFLVSNAIGVAATGWFSVRFGRKFIFVVSIGGFTVSSLLCANATTLEELVLYRVLQGILSAPILPLSQAIMLDTYPRERHSFAMTIWSIAMILGPVLGPSVGAYLTEIYSWRAIFYINIPFGVLGFIGCWLTVPETERRPQHLDWLGFLSLSVAVGAFQLMLDRGHRLDWFESTEIVIEATLAALALYIFIVHSATTRRPYINFAVFRDSNFVVGLFLIFLFGLNIFSALLLMPLFLQDVQGYPVIAAGIIISSRGVGTAFGMIVAGRLADRIGYRYAIVASLIMVAVPSAFMVTWTDQVPAYDVLVVNILTGVGIGMLWVALSTVTFSTLSAELRTEAASLFALLRVIGASIGVSVFVNFLAHSTQVNYGVLVENINAFNDTLAQFHHGRFWSLDSLNDIAELNRLVTHEAQMIAFLNDFKLLVLTSVIGIPLALLFRRKAEPAE